ncbi:MAG: family 10 glycosylhydrolase [Paludibacteraceae bacterium]|nr:family 10 glycosylhydrolase [Paludibacteraceae bacterium]
MKRYHLTVLLIICLGMLTHASPKREMRAAWIATVANIDWPSKAAIGHPQLQQKEMLAILDSAQALGLNMVIFQIRPTADALYHSQLEPWSNWLTGKQGEWPQQKHAQAEAIYDPLTFVCEEAHKRCIDVHVWLNPYRVTNGFDIRDLAQSHIYQQKKHLFVKYGKQWYFDPGLKETRDWLVKVVADIVNRYDVDGIHFDDYFYPYRIPKEEFPDSASFAAFPRGFTDKEAWRRNNVDLVIQELHDTITAIKPWVEFGISPFGVWRNKTTDPERGSNTRAGVQNYDDLYADILLWLEQGWIDYVVPQLYWEIGKKVADYQTLAHWWAEYSYGKNLYIGHSVSGVGQSKIEAWNRPNEICRQIRLNRSIPEVQGSVFFPIHTLMENRLGLCDSLVNELYRYPALQPSVRTDAPVAAQPQNLKIERTQDGKSIILKWTGTQDASYYIVYAFPKNQDVDFDDAQYILAKTHDHCLILPSSVQENIICVTTFNRYHQESLPACF